MATLLLTAAGSLLGPIGGALGALVGRQIDTAILGRSTRDGPRLKELAVTTSSYGAPLPRHFGRMRVAGTIIWATELVEHRDKQGGGKGRPSVNTYSYSASFAVALASRPILGIGRIWADGNLLRGAAGDLKTAGSFRLHRGEGDQQPDPLIAAAEGMANCPAFRGTAYVVFEDLQLGDFGNRIPALTFEVFADECALSLQQITDGVIDNTDAVLPLPGLEGMSCEGPLAETLAMLDPVFPMDCDACGDQLTLSPERLQAQPISLAEPAISAADGAFGGIDGHSRQRAPAPAAPPRILRYYDVGRDYQPGLQRAAGAVPAGQPRSIELPAALHAQAARRLIDSAARRAGWARETMSWRSCELDPEVVPGAIVTVPGHTGRWRVNEWEWGTSGVELALRRISPALTAAPVHTDPGRPNPPEDLTASPSALRAFELPWDGIGDGDTPAIFAAASSAGAGWPGAALFVDHGRGDLVPLGASGRSRSIIGTVISPPIAASPHLFDRSSALIVELIGADMMLTDATIRQMTTGANRALVGNEIVQFGSAAPLNSRQWRLALLLRGRGGTESAIAGHLPGEPFVLLDEAPLMLDAALIGADPQAEIIALGLGDTVPVASAIANRGITRRPPAPVHGRANPLPGGTLELSWVRRARGAFFWNDGVDTPVNEQAERYLVTYGPLTQPVATWSVATPRLTLSGNDLAALTLASPNGVFSIRQQGNYALSEPLQIPTPI